MALALDALARAARTATTRAARMHVPPTFSTRYYINHSRMRPRGSAGFARRATVAIALAFGGIAAGACGGESTEPTPNPVPAVVTLAPATVTAGGAGFAL